MKQSLRAINFSPRVYVRSAIGDSRASLGRVLRDRAALATIILWLLPWWSLIFLRDHTDWVIQVGESAGVVLVFWWMSRSGPAPSPAIKRPRLEFLLAIALVAIWIEWRVGICAKILPGLPSDFSCYKNWQFEIAPKVFEQVLLPFVTLWGLGYRLRAQGLDLNWRAWWIALPVLLAAAAYGFYIHQKNPQDFMSKTGEFFFAAGLPEEYLFRAFLMTRLEAWWRNPAWALFGSSVIFGLSHLPIDFLVFTNRNWRETWIILLTFQMGLGAVFAFAYMRTRNVLPIALLHAMVDAF